MPTFYWSVDTTRFILQPQLTRWRSRFRGPRESWKQNLEMNQIAYDIYQLYNRLNGDELLYGVDQFNIEFGTSGDGTFTINSGILSEGVTYNNPGYTFNNIGVTFSDSGTTQGQAGITYDDNQPTYDDLTVPYDSSTSIGGGTPQGTDIKGTQDLVRRLQELQVRVELLELKNFSYN